MRVLIVDDHPAVRAGLRALLRLEPGLAPVAVASSYDDALGMVEPLAIDCLLADFHLGDRDGLELCRTVKRLPMAPGFVLYSAFADDRLACAARLSGADAVVAKAAEPEVIFEALRHAARRLPFGPPPPQLLAGCGDALEIEDVPLVAMLLEGASLAEAAAAIGVDAATARWRLERAIAALVGRPVSQLLAEGPH